MQQNREQDNIIKKVLGMRQEHPRLGTRKLHFILKSEIKVGRDKLFEILRKE